LMTVEGAIPGWFGSMNADIGAPFTSFVASSNETSRDSTQNPADAPFSIQRVGGGDPVPVADESILAAEYFTEFLDLLESAHNEAHVNIGGDGGTMSDIMISTEDPVFFLLHSNVDRLWATWQAREAPYFSSPDDVFGDYSQSWPTNWPLASLDGMYMGTQNIDPWSGGNSYMTSQSTPLRPWASPDNTQLTKSYIDPTIRNAALYEAPDGVTVY
jgi:hypothetical protein